MRVIQISTSSSGGAGVAASRLTALLSQGGIETKLITRDYASKTKNELGDFASRTLGKLVTCYQNWISDSGRDLITPLSVGQISLSTIDNFKPDIVHIHNWYNQLSLDNLKYLGERFPLVFTLHDERLLTGGCHMTLGCQRFLTGCANCPAVSRNRSLIARKKVELALVLQGIPKYGVITPSVWLLNQAVKSHVAGGPRQSKVIPNAMSFLDPGRNNRYKSESSREVQLLFVAADLSAYVKGFQLAVESVANFVTHNSDELDVKLHVVGSNLPSELMNQKDFSLELHGYLSESDLSRLMLDMDALLITSHSENSPNIIAEAQIRGLLIIARDTGGISELIIESKNGFLTGSTAASIADGIQRFINHDDKQSLSDNSAQFANEHWGRDRILAQHKAFYSQLLGIQ